MDNTCVCCGKIIPEGRMVCPECEHEDSMSVEDVDFYVKLRQAVEKVLAETSIVRPNPNYNKDKQY